MAGIWWIVAVVIAAAPHAQPPGSALQAHSTSIIGRVIDGATGQPMSGATVVLDSSERRYDPARALVPPPAWLTDGDGQFAFRDLRPGTYSLQVFKQGYMESGRSLAVRDGEPVGNQTIRLSRYSTISGTVVDDFGEPIVETQVKIYARGRINGLPVLEPLQIARTNDLGEYRVTSLQAGEYVVAAPDVSGDAAVPSAGAPAMAYATRYHPNGSMTSQAKAIAISAGEERTGIDLVLRLQPVSTVSGVLTGPMGPAVGLALHLVPSDDGTATDPSARVSVTDASGAFQFTGIPSGQYVIRTQRPAPVLLRTHAPVEAGNRDAVVQVVRDLPPLWTAHPITVGESDISGLLVTLREGITITGRVEFTDSAERPAPEEIAKMGVSIVRTDGALHADVIGASGLPGSLDYAASSPIVRGRGSVMPEPMPSARLDENGRFRIANVLPGQFRLRTQTIGRWSLKTALLNGVDVADEPFTVESADIGGVAVTFTDRHATLKFTVQAPVDAAGGSPDLSARRAAVIVLPSDPALLAGPFNSRRMRMTAIGVNGGSTGFTIPGGEYYVIAVLSEHATGWEDPGVREELVRSAMRLSIVDGDSRTIELVLSSLKPRRDR